jgi:hypothetical protein
MRVACQHAVPSMEAASGAGEAQRWAAKQKPPLVRGIPSRKARCSDFSHWDGVMKKQALLPTLYLRSVNLLPDFHL